MLLFFGTLVLDKIHWNMGNYCRIQTLLLKSSYQLPVPSQSVVSPFLLCAGILTSLVLFRSYANNHICYDEHNYVVMLRRYYFAAIISDTWLLQSFHPHFFSVP